MSDLLLTFLVGMLAGVIGSLAHKWSLEHKVTQLEFDLYSAIERINTEIKRRASLAGKQAKQFDEAVLSAAGENKPAPAPEFWWMPFVKQRETKTP